MDAEKNMIENGETERKEIKKKKREVGGIKPIPFILGNEISERFATTGFQTNMISYLTQKLNLPLVQASNTLTNFNGTAGFTPLIGGLIADAFVGRYWTIILGSSIYTLGLVSIIISAVLPGLRPPPCPTQVDCKEASTFQLSILYISLLLTSLGLGGIRPCVITFAADQIGMSKAETESRSWNFFNWYYFFLDLATLIAITFLVYVQDNVSWGWGLGIPTISMALSIVVFIIGSRFYKKENPEGSPLVRLVQVIVASVSKRKEVVPEDSTLLYTNKNLDASISSNGRLVHTNDFKWLDKAAVVTDSDQTHSPNQWRLSTVHRVEELKSIVRMLPIWASGILQIAAYSHQESFSIQQGRTMDRHLTHSNSFQIPPATMQVFDVFTVLIGLLLYERLFVPFARRFTRNPTGITCLQRIGIGYTICILGTVVAALVEIKRKSVAADYNLLDKPVATIPISVFWLVPQYSLHGIALVFFNVGKLEFFYDQSPESMRSTAASFYWIAIALGNYAGTLIVSLLHDYTSKKSNWIPNRNLNRGKLEYYYLFVSGLQVINLIYYFICTMFYTYKALEEVSEEACEDRCAELANISSRPVEEGHGNGETLM
ncbi:protein NRT1/ PTR FAMILY 3.1-like [Camellia sinensis]|uniref:Major facilitator superfamily (MFS) profile domain-containing protein n=1 Tax=Camellia sinensis var. sinensis TaxID=542762 RepID=A0A4S4EZ96_CAMSN|nr:protein NRT1/ PTR FAMILY 3.1-like [Camellia sinensis]THG22421.1 hypothetical protein TEA_026170 [Camellia sinensis var. sinensis]